MKKITSMLALAVALVMCVGVMAACTGGNNEPENTTTLAPITKPDKDEIPSTPGKPSTDDEVTDGETSDDEITDEEIPDDAPTNGDSNDDESTDDAVTEEGTDSENGEGTDNSTDAEDDDPAGK